MEKAPVCIKSCERDEEFIFNVEERRCCDFSDSLKQKGLVRACEHERTVAILVDRYRKQSTLTAGFAVDGYWMNPFVILARGPAE
jgi:hypothetical protein